MRLDGERESENIEDRRSDGGGGGGGGFPIRLAGGGLGTIVLVVIALFLGVDPSAILSGGGDAPPQTQEPPARSSPDTYPRAPQGQDRTAERQGASADGQDGMRRFVAQILATTEDTWTDIFRRAGRDYAPPNLVLFSGGTQSACGFAQTAVGPFYCPGDRKVYLDTAFFRDMERKLNAPGDFARGYVIAHEVGHHVQNQLGILAKVEQERRGLDRASANALQVRVELQADCFAGVWANRTDRARQLLEPGDVEEGLNAAASVGDDRLQRQAQGTVVPESFTHGSSAQRVRWFRAGLEAGDIRRCDTFAGAAADRL